MAIEPRQKQLWLYEFTLNGFVLLRQFLPADLIQEMYHQVIPIVRGEIARIERGETQRLRGRNRLSVDLRPYIHHLKGPLDDERFQRNPVIEELVGSLMKPWRYGGVVPLSVES